MVSIRNVPPQPNLYSLSAPRKVQAEKAPVFGQKISSASMPSAALHFGADTPPTSSLANIPGIQRRVIPEKAELVDLKAAFQSALDGFNPDGVTQLSQLFQFRSAMAGPFKALSQMLGFKTDDPTPRMVLADAYTAASENYISQDAKDFSSYHIAFRREQTPWMKELGLKPADSRYVFFGLQQIIDDIILNPITKEEINEADKFYATAKGGKPFKWDRSVWDRVVNECDGKLPIKIEALADGAVAFPGEPVIQVTAKEGFGELSAWFETKMLQVWATSERASLLRHWLEYNKDLVRRCTNEDLTEAEVTAKAQAQLADFSDRSSMTAQESELLGLATLTSFPTTSTVAAAYRAYKESGENPASKTSMYSLAHRVVQSYLKEKDAYLALFDFAKTDIASYVADCYNFRKAVTDYLVPLAQEAKKTCGIICARPDSGDAFEEILFVLKEATKAGLYKEVTARDGSKLKAMTNLRVIQADGMTFATIKAINEKLIAAGFSPPDCVYYGVGGFLHDSLSRSNTSAAQKLCAVGNEERPVMKSPIGAKGKESIPGQVKIVREAGSDHSVRGVDEPGENALKVWYDGTGDGPGLLYKEDFREVQKRVLNDFKKDARPARLLSDAVTATQDRLREEYQNLSA